MIEKVKKQVEFYFSDANYRMDKFLREKCTAEGGLDINVLLTFKKIKELGATKEDILESIKDSAVVKYEEDKLVKIEQNKDYLEEDVSERVVFVGGFDKNSGLEEIENFLKSYCTPMLIRMRKDKYKKFNGNVLVEVKSKEEAENMVKMEIFVEVDANEDAKENGTKEKETEEVEKKRKINDENIKKKKRLLKVMLKKDFFEMKKNDEKDMKLKKKISKEYENRLFSFELENEMSIKEIKSAIDGVAFVDLKLKVIRFKKPQQFKNKEFTEEGGNKIKLEKLSEEKEFEYVKELKQGKKNTK